MAVIDQTQAPLIELLLLNGLGNTAVKVKKLEAAGKTKDEVLLTILNGEDSEPELDDDEQGSTDEAAVKANGTPTDVPGLTCEVKNVYQKIDKNNQVVWVNEYPKDLDEPVENRETAKFALIVRNKKSYDSRKKLEIDSIIIQSPLLKKSLEPVMEDYPGITVSLERLTFRAPFKPFVHRWERFCHALAATDEGSETQEHLKLLHRILEAELSDLIATKKDHVANGVITFDHMWTIFEPGARLYGAQDGHERAFELISTRGATDPMSGAEYLGIQAWCVDWDGNKMGKCHQNLRNFEFVGTKKITSLAVYPLEFHPDRKRLEAKLLERGKLFEKYAGYQYMAYKGIALGYGPCGMIKHTVDSRVIIDTEAHNKFVPNKAVTYNALPKTTRMQVDLVNSNGNDDQDDEYYSDNDDDEYDSDVNDTIDGDGTSKDVPKRRQLTEWELMMTVPYVRGYALKNKKWLWFFVAQIYDIGFNENAFASLVLPAQQKDLIHAFVESQIGHKDTFDDIIAGKGRGMILLLAGPPGVGKTLTAESVAENLRVPLYMMSAGDLGLEPSEIEDSLNTIMEMVAKWNAVLLLDEADVFLEARTSHGHDLDRNKMVSIFLRILEYYEGILFLTTNRIKNIDEAFHSRIHITMQYPPLNKESRQHIWKTFLREKASVTQAEVEEVSDVDINGRQIKNVLKTARMLAGRKGDDGVVKMSHIKTVLAIERGNVWQ